MPVLPPPTLGRVLLPLLPLLLPPTLGRALPLLPLPLLPLVAIVLLTLLVLGRTALRLPALLVMVPVLPVERFTELLPVERFTVLLLPLLRLMVLLLLPPTLGRMLEPLLLLVLGEVDTALLVEGRALTLLTEERAELLLLLTAALFFGETVATLRLPAAAALEVDAGRRPWAIAPVEVMASPLASIKPIIVL